MKKIAFCDYKNVIGRTLYKIRSEKHISQTDLAARMQVMNVNIDQQMISKIEKNQRQVTDYEFACFCVCLKVSPNELLSEFYDIVDKL